MEPEVLSTYQLIKLIQFRTHPRSFTRFPFLLLRIRKVRIECRLFLSCTLIIRRALAVLRRLGIDTVFMLRVFPWVGQP